MSKLSRIRTDYVQRYHLSVDTEAPNLDAFVVELFSLAPVVVHDYQGHRGTTPDDLWREALAALAMLRAQPNTSPYPRAIFIPFANITVVDAKQAIDAHELSILSIVSRVDDEHAVSHPLNDHMSHEYRVAALCRMADLLEMDGSRAGEPMPFSRNGSH